MAQNKDIPRKLEDVEAWVARGAGGTVTAGTCWFCGKGRGGGESVADPFDAAANAGLRPRPEHGRQRIDGRRRPYHQKSRANRTAPR